MLPGDVLHFTPAEDICSDLYITPLLHWLQHVLQLASKFWLTMIFKDVPRITLALFEYQQSLILMLCDLSLAIFVPRCPKIELWFCCVVYRFEIRLQNEYLEW
ncbi:hypothetical protein WN944_019439 [Citrus x changshan-huyou]|uniref:Uncharacterized protein n=1 Tax=Citrus x changshan-huyou TaxID=2935761 RepID=A0AAP0LVG6_9ROSI